MATNVKERPVLLSGQKPIVDDLSRVNDFNLNRVKTAMVRQGIGREEVLSAIVSPDRTDKTPGASTVMYYRGDLRVWVDMDDREVLEVVDVDKDQRRMPRSPLERTAPKAGKGPKSTRPTRGGKKPPAPPREVVHELPESEEAHWLLGSHNEPDARFIWVTPVLAQALLDRNVGYNRPKRARDSEDWADQMIEGKWKVTHQGFALDRNGHFIDGQHRAEAIVLSEVPAYVLVVVGLDSDVYDVIDTGRRRSLADGLSSLGYFNVALLAATIRLLYVVKHDLVSTKAGRRVRLHNDALLQFFLTEPEAITEALRRGSNLAGAIHGRASSLAVGIYLIRQHPRADEFISTMAEGTGLDKHDPRFVYRRLNLNYTGKDRADAIYFLAAFLKAWAAFLDNRPVRLLAYRTDEAFPPIAGIDQPELSGD